MELSELENHIKHDGKELMRRLLIGHLAERGTGDIGLNVILMVRSFKKWFLELSYAQL